MAHPTDSETLVLLRRRLHALAELSGQEAQTASMVAEELARCRPDELITGLGGQGIAVVFQAEAPGPTVMLRAELDALPIDETLDLDHASFTPGVAHKCGHDGHMAILLGVARRLADDPLPAGRCVLLFQPAEETGAGAAAVLADPRFELLQPDWIFALHNLPGYRENAVLIREGPFAVASAGLTVRLAGHTSHAAYPERGRSPDRALAELTLDLINLPDPWQKRGHLALVTVVHSRLGRPAFGVTPGEAEILATLRADDDTVLAELKEAATAAAERRAKKHGLTASLSFSEEFPAVRNHPEAAGMAHRAAADLNLEVLSPEESPFRWSEDFGRLATLGKGALIGLGSGIDHPVLHAEEYDFNDGILTCGVDLLQNLAIRLLGDSPLLS